MLMSTIENTKTKYCLQPRQGVRNTVCNQDNGKNTLSWLQTVLRSDRRLELGVESSAAETEPVLVIATWRQKGER